MEPVNTFVGSLQALAWPVAVALSVFMLRGALSQLLVRLKKGELLGATFEFNSTGDSQGSLAASVEFYSKRASKDSETDARSARPVVMADVAASLDRAYRSVWSDLSLPIQMAAENPNLATILAARALRIEIVLSYTARLVAEPEAFGSNPPVVDVERMAECLRGNSPLNENGVTDVKRVFEAGRKCQQGKQIDADSATRLVDVVTIYVAQLRVSREDR